MVRIILRPSWSVTEAGYYGLLTTNQVKGLSLKSTPPPAAKKPAPKSNDPDVIEIDDEEEEIDDVEEEVNDVNILRF